MKKITRTISTPILRWNDGTSVKYITDISEKTAKKMVATLGLKEYEYGIIDMHYSMSVDEFQEKAESVIDFANGELTNKMTFD